MIVEIIGMAIGSSMIEMVRETVEHQEVSKNKIEMWKLRNTQQVVI